MNARLRPIRSPILLPIRMNAADTSASRAIALWTLLAVVPRSCTTAEIDTFISEVSTTRTNIAIARRIARLRSPAAASAGGGAPFSVTARGSRPPGHVASSRVDDAHASAGALPRLGARRPLESRGALGSSLRGAEDGKRHAEAEQRARDDVREPVHLQIRATPSHPERAEGGESPPCDATRPRGAEEQNDRHARDRGIGRVARRERRADGAHDGVRWPRAADGDLQERGEERRDRLGEGERQQRAPPAPEEERGPDRAERERLADAA